METTNSGKIEPPFGEGWRADQMKKNKSELIDFIEEICKERLEFIEACEQLINADHYEHFAARLNDQEMKGIEMIKAALKKEQMS